MTATRITVDNITYRVLVEYDSLKRSFELMEGDNTGVAVSGRSIRDILGTNYKHSMTVRADPSYPSDYDLFYWMISEPVDYHSVSIPCGNYQYDTTIWAVGALNASTGANSSSTTRVRTTNYINTSITDVNVLSGYKFAVAAYNSSGTYQGMWNGTALAKSLSWNRNTVQLSNIGSYKFKIMAAKEDDSTMTAADYKKIALNYSDISFDAKILSGEDVYKGYMYNHKYWDQLEVTFEPMEPQRK